MAEKFKTLADMVDNSIRVYAANRLFGTKQQGEYTWITYADFGEQVTQFRGALAANGVKSGDRVAIIANNRTEWAVGAYATYQLGAAYVPMYESQTADDWAYILNDSTPTVLIVSRADIYEKVAPIGRNVRSIRRIIALDDRVGDAVHYRDALAQGKEHPIAVQSVDPASMCGLIYTSGTTGKPKGVMLSHANIISNINSILDIFPLAGQDVSLSFLPWAHSFGQTCELHGMISCGAAIGLAERVDTIIANLSEVKPTILFSVPRIFNRIYDGLHKKMASESSLKRKLFYSGLDNATKVREMREAGKSLGWTGFMNKIYDKLVFSKVRMRLGGNLKYAISGGAALSPEVARFIDNLNIEVYEGYGLSETSPIMTANFPGNRRIGSVGKPIPGVTVKIDKNVDSGNPDVGEIINYGPNTMMGYFNKSEETAKVMTSDGGFRTGDLGRYDKDGFLFITGRVKEQYKLENGKYVAPAPLEEQLQLSPFILQAMIYGDNKLYNVVLMVPDFSSLEEWVKAQGLGLSDRKEIIRDQNVRKLLAGEIERYTAEWKGYERPKHFHLLAEEWSTDNDMLTPTLKLKRRNVVKHYEVEIMELYERERGA